MSRKSTSIIRPPKHVFHVIKFGVKIIQANRSLCKLDDVTIKNFLELIFT